MLLDRPVHPLGALERGVQIGHVGRVMLVVMDLHRAGVDVRLQRVEVVRQLGGTLVGHLPPPPRILVGGKDMLRGVPDLHVEETGCPSFVEIRPRELEARAPRVGRHLTRDRSRRTTACTRATSGSETRSSSGSRAPMPDAANQVYLDLRALKVDLTFAIGGIKNHEVYFEHLGGEGGDPSGAVRRARGP